MKQSGVLDSLKSNLRARLYERLDLKNEKKAGEYDATEIRNRHTFRLAVSLVADLMEKCDMPYAKSVFLPECGMNQGALAKSEMGLFGVLSSFPVHNPHTAYTAMMSPAAGTMAAFVRTSMCPETPGDAVIDSRYCQR